MREKKTLKEEKPLPMHAFSFLITLIIILVLWILTLLLVSWSVSSRAYIQGYQAGTSYGRSLAQQTSYTQGFHDGMSAGQIAGTNVGYGHGFGDGIQFEIVQAAARPTPTPPVCLPVSHHDHYHEEGE
jgi:hypothetical protein